MLTQIANFLNGNLARSLFALLAIVLAIFAWFQYQEIGALKMERSAVGSAEQLQELSSNPAVTKCKDTIFAAIDQRVADGFLDAEKVDAEKEEALSLCVSKVRSGAYD
jgi:hypothetical protein